MKKKTEAILKKNKNEDFDLIEKIEKIFLKRKKIIFKKPKKGDSVILLLSGGFDSIAAWYFLMKDYDLNVYPLVLGKKNPLSKKIRSINYYSKYFEKKFPKNFHHAYYVKDPTIGQKKIIDQFLNKKKLMKNSDDFIIEYISKGQKEIEILGQSTILIFTAKTYADLLKAKKNINIKNIFLATLITDGIVVKHQTLTSLRISNLLVSFLTNDWDLQTSSIFNEPELNNLFDKERIINKFIKSEGLNLYKSFSCDKKLVFHCGTCLSCKLRKLAFENQNVKDKTIYLSDISNKIEKLKERILKKIEHEIKKILHTK